MGGGWGDCGRSGRGLDWRRDRAAPIVVGAPSRIEITPERSSIMDRRDVLGWLSAGAAAGGLGFLSPPARGGQAKSQEEPPANSAARGLPPLKITDISTILTAPN